MQASRVAAMSFRMASFVNFAGSSLRSNPLAMASWIFGIFSQSLAVLVLRSGGQPALAALQPIGSDGNSRRACTKAFCFSVRLICGLRVRPSPQVATYQFDRGVPRCVRGFVCRVHLV